MRFLCIADDDHRGLVNGRLEDATRFATCKMCVCQRRFSKQLARPLKDNDGPRVLERGSFGGQIMQTVTHRDSFGLIDQLQIRQEIPRTAPLLLTCISIESHYKTFMASQAASFPSAVSPALKSWRRHVLLLAATTPESAAFRVVFGTRTDR